MANQIAIRSLIHAEKGNVLVSCDLSQAETWIVAYLARDENMKHALKNDDIHSTTAKAIFDIKVEGSPKELYKNGIINKEQRYTGKRTNHATSYKMGPFEFVKRYNEDSDPPINIGTAKRYQEAWHKLYPGVKNWWADTEHTLRTTGGMLTTPYGRRITFFGPLDSYIKEAIACVPQSTVADHFRGRVQQHHPHDGGLRAIDLRLPAEARIVQQGHDSAVVECPEAIGLDVANIMKECLYRPIIINGEEVYIPVDGEMGYDWGNLDRIKW